MPLHLRLVLSGICLAIGLLGAGPVARASVLFSSAQAVSTAVDGARNLAAGDLDRDGDLDLVVAATDSDQVIWFENTDGAGSFGPGTVITSLADAVQFVSVGDLDGDTTLSAFGYVHAPTGASSGIPGVICNAAGVFDPTSGAQDLLNAVGPCRINDGTSVF